MPEQQPQVDEVFDEALRRAAGPDRDRYLDEACGGDLELRRRVERLLRAVAEAGSFLEAPAQDPSPTVDQPPGERPGTVIGPYKLIEEIGEGGMGTVWMAQQTEPVKRLVALKFIKAGMDSKQVITRFEAERQALALMDHPNIAKVLDAGTVGDAGFQPARGGDAGKMPAPQGRPYFVMELVKGVPITRYCDEHRLTPRQRLELFIPVCHAMQHAHQKGIIHRDIKPSNVLVTLYDGKPVPKVIDFGVAKAAGQSLTEKTLVTGFGNIVGTLEYMSPEQAEINQLDIDTRSDIYSLGVLLYELLTGSPPFSRKELEKAGMLEMLRVIREKEPSKPSTKLSTAEGLPTLAANRGTEPAKLTKLVRGELDWIVMKALEKDRNRRYETANSFAMDVQRYLADEPVQACPPSVGYRVRKFARRNRAALGMGTAVALAVLAAVVGLAVSNVRINREKAQKEAALTEAEANLLLARQAVDEIYTPVADQLAILPHMQPFQRHVLQKALNFYQEFARRKGSDPAIRLEVARASSRVLSLKMALGQYDQDELRWREVITTLQQLGEELPSHRKPRLELASAHLTLGSVLISSGQTQEGEQNIRQALALYGEVAAEQPDEPKHRARLAAALNSLGNSAQGGPGEAEKYHREAIRLCEALAAEWPDEPSYQGEWARSHFMLGQLLANVYRWPQAEAAFRQTLAIVAEAPESLSRTHYRFLTPGAQYHLALVLQAQQRTEEAEAAYRQAVTSGERNMAQWPDFPSYGRELAVYYLGLAQFLARRDRSEDAAAFKRSGLELAEKVLPDLTDDTQPRYQVIAELTDYSRRLRDAGELKAAERVLGKALELAKKLAAESPAEPRYQHQLAVTYGTLGTILIRGCRCQEAADAHREQLAIYEKLATAFPADPDYRYHQANAANFLGIALRRLPKELETSVRHHRQAIKLCESLVAQFPNQPSYRLELARSHYSLGLDLWMSGRWTEAEAAYRQALADVAPLGDQAGNFEGRYSATAPSVRNDWAWLLATCPDAKVRDPKRAVELAQKAVELDPRGSYWNTLGVAQYRAGNFQEALAALGKSMELQEGGNSFDWFFVAMVHWRLDRKDEARQWYNKAVAWMEKHQPKNEELRRFRAEAEELLGIDKM